MEGEEEALEVGEEKSDAMFEGGEVFVGECGWWFVRDGGGKVGTGEDGVVTGFAHTDVEAEIAGRFLGGWICCCICQKEREKGLS